MATIQGVYLALFGRPADPTGLTYFNSVTKNGADLSAIGNLAGTAEYQTRFAGQSNIQIINSIYQSLFGRDADVSGLTFFANGLASGKFNINNIAISILDGAQGSDLTTVNNKIAAANLYTSALDTTAEIVAYNGTAAADAGRTFISGVTTTVPTQTAVDAAVAAMTTGGGVPGTTYTLTTGIDSITGTANNDTIRGDNTTLQATDVINGGAGKDTFEYTDARATATAGDAIPAAVISNVEIFNIRNVNGTAASAGTKEVATVTFADITIAQNNAAADTVQLTIDGRTITLTGSTTGATTFTAANIAAAFAGTLSAGITATGALTNYTAAVGSGGAVVFTATAVGNLTNLTVTKGGSVGAGVSDPAVAVTDGTAAVTSTGANLVVNAANYSGATDFNSVNSTSKVTFSGLSGTQNVGIKGAVANGDVDYTLAAAATSTTINVADGTKQGTVTNTGATVATAVINSTGAANTLTGIDLGSGTNTASLTINAATNLKAGVNNDFTNASALVVSGAATKVELTGSAAATFKTIDASGLTAGGLFVELNAVNTSFKGGAGNDQVKTAALAATVASSVDAGAGTGDIILVGATSDVDTAAKAKVYANFEVLDVARNTTAVDASLFTNSTINAVKVGQNGAVTNLTATQAANVTVYETGGSPTIGVKDATVTGNIDTVKITVDDASTTVNTITLGTPVLAGIENLQLTGVDNITINALTAATALTSLTAGGSINYNVTTGAVDFASNTKFDFSAVNGTVSFDASLAQAGTSAGGLAIVGSASKDNTILDTNKADSITGGAGTNTLTLKGGADTVDLTKSVAKADTITLSAATNTTKTGFVSISGFTSAVTTGDKLDIAGAGTSFTVATSGTGNGGSGATSVTATINSKGVVTFSAIGASATLSDHIDAVFASLGGAVTKEALFQYGSDTYVVANVANDTTYNAGTDYIVKLVGVTGVTELSSTTSGSGIVFAV